MKTELLQEINDNLIGLGRSMNAQLGIIIIQLCVVIYLLW